MLPKVISVSDEASITQANLLILCSIKVAVNSWSGGCPPPKVPSASATVHRSMALSARSLLELHNRESSRKSSARVCTGFSQFSNPSALVRSRAARAALPYPGGRERRGSAPGAGQVPRRPGGTARCRGVTRKRNGRQRNQFRVRVAVGAGGKRRWERAGPAGIRHVRAPNSPR